MAQPPRYNRGPSVIEYATLHPAAPFPPALIEGEFNEVKETLDATLDNLALIQRDDGKLANGAVGPDTFSSSALLLMGGNWIPRGVWATLTVYAISDVVEQSGVAYVCAIAHTAGVFNTDKAAGRWITLGSTAGGVIFVPVGTISSTDVQSAVAEVSGDVTVLDAALAAHVADAFDAHDAHAISNVPAGSLVATNVQTAIDELDATISALYPNKADISVNTALTAVSTKIPQRITAGCTVTLPDASTVAAGDPFIFKSYTTGNVQIAPNGADTIDNVNANLRLASFEAIELRRFGNDWMVTIKPAWEVGNVKAHDGAVIPAGWVARGSIGSRSLFAGLFAVVGETYDKGDGVNTFGMGGASAGRALIGDGTGTATVSGVNADVDTSTDTFAVPANADKWLTTMLVTFTLASGTVTGLASGVQYYVIRNGTTGVKFASTLANAQNGVAIDFTAKSNPVWTLTHSLTTRAQGETTGREFHGMTLAELLAHTHGLTHNALNSGAGAVSVDGLNTSTVQTNSTGGNTAMSMMQPVSVTKFIIKT